MGDRVQVVWVVHTDDFAVWEAYATEKLANEAADRLDARMNTDTWKPSRVVYVDSVRVLG